MKERAKKSIVTKNSEIYRFARVVRAARPIIQLILASLEKFQERDSGWALLRILNLTINVNKLNPLRGMSHRSATRNSDEMSDHCHLTDDTAVQRIQIIT